MATRRITEDIFADFLQSVETLDKERAAVDELIEKWDEKLGALDLGIETWVSAEPEGTAAGVARGVELGYRGGLIVRHPSHGGAKVEPLAKANYEVKIEALNHLSRLLVDVRLMVNEQISRIQRMKEAVDFENLKKRLKLPLMHPPRRAKTD
jgi:hypothetical protein